MRRFHPGQAFDMDGLHFRIRQGLKGPDDLVLEHQSTDGRWRKTRMRLGAFLADFFYENEDVLYPPPSKGGRYYLDFCRQAVKHGWEKADAVLRLERRQAGTLFETDDKEAS